MGAASRALGIDGRPIIEVAQVRRDAECVFLRGTAIAFEGTVLITTVGIDGAKLRTVVCTATKGGPARGTWRATVPLDPGAECLLVELEAMEETPMDVHENQTVRVAVAAV